MLLPSSVRCTHLFPISSQIKRGAASSSSTHLVLTTNSHMPHLESWKMDCDSTSANYQIPISLIPTYLISTTDSDRTSLPRCPIAVDSGRTTCERHHSTHVWQMEFEHFLTTSDYCSGLKR